MEKALLPSAQAIEKGEKHNTDPGGDERIQKKAEREHGHGMGEKRAFRDGQNHLMEMEEDEYEPEAADGMLGIDSRADGRRDVAYTRFCDAVHADGIVVAQRVLSDADGRSEKHTADRIAAAHAEVDGYEQGQVDKFNKTAVFVKERLQDKSEKTDEWNGSAIVFVNLDIGFRSGAGAQHDVHVNYARAERLLARSWQRRDSACLLRGVLLSSSVLVPAA